MKKLGQFLFVAVFLLMALIPFAGMLIFGPAEAAANEILAFPPSCTEEDGSFNKAVLNDASDYLADHFYLRQELITADAKLESALLGESAADDVVLGSDGWLYYASTLDDYRGQNLMTERELWCAAHTLALVNEYASQNGAKMLFVIVPNKNEVYPEHMPSWALKAEEPGNREKLRAALEQAGVPYLDLTSVLTEKKTEVQLYQTTDSHWNNLGAALACDAILERLGMQGEAYDPSAFVARRDHAADLYEMLYPTGSEPELQYYPDRAWRFEYTKKLRSVEDQMILTACDSAAGRLLMFRDSFGNTLHTFMAEGFAEATFSRAMPYNLQLIASKQPDTLVLELVQRNLRWLAQRAPIMPAPVRELDLSGAQAIPSVSVTQTDAENGMFRFTGAVPDADVDSPVWLICDGTVYEASPAGSDPGGFTAYLPGPSEAGLLVAYLRGGALQLTADCGGS